MARNRMLNPEFWLDEGMAELSPLARLLYMGLWGICDDNYATLPNRPKWIKAQIFPYEDVNTPQLLTELSESGKLIKFVADDNEEYFYIKNFFKYQKVEKPSKPKYPQFEEIRVVVPDSSPTSRSEEKIREVKLSKEKRSETVAVAPVAPLGFGNKDINDVIENFKLKFRLPLLDGSVKENRRYANLLLKKNGGLERTLGLISLASEDEWWKNNITSCKDLYYKSVKIVARKRGDTPKIAVIPKEGLN